MQLSLGVMDGHVGGRGRVRERILLAGVFTAAALRYWLTVFPGVARQLARWRRRADGIADPVLRGLALDALAKSGNIEGAAAFATFVPRSHRKLVLRAVVAFQTAYNYLDLLTEQLGPDPAANARRLHEALLVALDPAATHLDYYEYNPQHDDDGYLSEIVEVCRGALGVMPSYAAVAPSARRAAERIVEFQSCNTGELQGDLAALERWARAATPPGEDLRWWETAAAGGSSLCVYALIALAAERDLDASLQTVAAVKDAYFPWTGALHSLLDNLVDVAEDRATGQHNLIGLYASPQEASTRMGRLAERSLHAARELPGDGDSLILAAMASFYLSTPDASLPAARPVARAVLDVLGKPAALAGLVFRLRRLASHRRRRGAQLMRSDRAHLTHEFVK